jgi:hypothetical protein
MKPGLGNYSPANPIASSSSRIPRNPWRSTANSAPREPRSVRRQPVNLQPVRAVRDQEPEHQELRHQLCFIGKWNPGFPSQSEVMRVGGTHAQTLQRCAVRGSSAVSAGSVPQACPGPSTQSAAIPFRPAEAGSPPVVPRLVSVPLDWIANIPTAPLAALSEKRNLPSALIVMSRFAEPDGFTARTVPGSGVSVPSARMAKPAMVEDPALEA